MTSCRSIFFTCSSMSGSYVTSWSDASAAQSEVCCHRCRHGVVWFWYDRCCAQNVRRHWSAFNKNLDTSASSRAATHRLATGCDRTDILKKNATVVCKLLDLGHAGLGHAELGQRDWDMRNWDSGTGTHATRTICLFFWDTNVERKNFSLRLNVCNNCCCY